MARVLRQPTEDQLLGRLRASGLVPRIGDDAAFLPASGPFAVTVDSQIADVHFPADLDVAVLARRLLAVNLSDLAAVGAIPRYAFLALCTPPHFDHRRFFRALLSATKAAGLELAGGDLAKVDRTTLSLTLLGERPKGGRWLTRSKARAGDVLWVGGTLGESALGQVLVTQGARMIGRSAHFPKQLEKKLNTELHRAARRAIVRHLSPTPQLELGLALGRCSRAAAIDISDGLARDLRRLCTESRVGAVLHAAALPRSAQFETLARRLGRNPLATALGGGEDYVLLFTLPRGTEPEPRFGAQAIGEITRARNLVLNDHGRESELPDLGWDHLAPSSIQPARS
jgi:thiamine-monophosphate kinase